MALFNFRGFLKIVVVCKTVGGGVDRMMGCFGVNWIQPVVLAGRTFIFKLKPPSPGSRQHHPTASWFDYPQGLSPPNVARVIRRDPI